MQFIEKNSFNVRSALYSMEKADSNTKFLLLPMVHIGTRAYYEQVTEKINKCDLVLLEGVKSKRAGLLTLSYRVVRLIKRMDLVTQQEALDITSFRNKILSADIKGEEFDHKWQSQAIWFRLQIYLMLPVYILYLMCFGTRQLIAEQMAVDDLQSSDEILFSDKHTEKLDDILLNERDKIVVKCISNLLVRNDSLTIAVVFGASHMRRIVEYLYGEQGFRITNSEWLTVFDL